MSFRTKIVLLTAVLVSGLVIGLSALMLNNTITSSLQDSLRLADLVAHQTQQMLIVRLGNVGQAAWSDTVKQDTMLASFLETTVAQSPSVLEISVADADGRVLTSNRASNVGAKLGAHPQLSNMRNSSVLGRIRSIYFGGTDYESRLAVGVVNQPSTVFTIQVLVSSVFLKDALVPRLLDASKVSLFALAAALLLVSWLAGYVSRNLRQITQDIELIRHGEALPDQQLSTSEFAAVQSRLRLLGSEVKDNARAAASTRVDAINRLASGVAHEIKNPLNSIAVRLALLEGIVGEVPEAEKEIRIIGDEIERLDRVVRTFLDFTRPVEVEKVEVDLAEIARDVATIVEPDGIRRGVEVSFSSTPESVLVTGDRDLLRQALMNLAVNAIDAMQNGGRLTIRVEGAGSAVRVQVKDSGPGIPAHQIDKVFELYYTTKPGGSGIGLPMVFRAVQLHGGTIEVKSEPGQGTAFHITLPARS